MINIDSTIDHKNYCMRRIVLTFIGVCVMAIASMAQSVVNLRTEHLVNPMSVDTKTPRLGWQIVSDKQGVMQKEYHIIVASTREKAERGAGGFGSTGK